MIRKIILFWKNNGVCGLVVERVLRIRGGAEKFPVPHSEPTNSCLSADQEAIIKKIANDPGISDSQRTILLSDLNRSQARELLNAHLQAERFRAMLHLANKHPVYSQVKRKAPIILGSLPMFEELRAQATYRAVQSASSPYTLQTYLGMALPAYIFFSMAEMVVPDSGKKTCKVLKWTLGAPIWVGSELLDKVTSNTEKRIFGEAIPADIQTFTGTMPDANDIRSMASIVEELKDKAGFVSSKLATKSYPEGLGKLSEIPLGDVLKEEQVLERLRQGTFGQNSDILEEAFMPTPIP